MMQPNQITSHSFSQNGKGGYKAIEVDAFLQRVYQSYLKLNNERKALSEKLDEVMPMLNEYNQRKNSIADALIWAKATAEKNIEEAQAIADKTIADANLKAEKLLESTKAEADAYYADKTASADEKVEKAKAEFERLKQESEIYSDRYIAEINVKTQTIIEDANAKAEAIVAAAYSDAKKSSEKADRIIATANAELESLKAEAAKIKNEISALITYAEKAADKIDNSVFDAVTNAVSDDSEEIAAKSIDLEEVESFTFEGIKDSFDDIEVDSPQPVESVEEEVKPSAQPEYVRFFGADMPDVNDLLSGIFNAVNDEKTRKQSNEDENSFVFSDIFASDNDNGSTRAFDAFMKDSEDTVDF